MSEFNVGVVFTTTAGREQNLTRALEFLLASHERPTVVAIVLDGGGGMPGRLHRMDLPVDVVSMPRHVPGQEQPRNVGVRALRERAELTHVWFLDSDILVAPEALTAYRNAWQAAGPATILVGPYDWMPEGVRDPLPEVKTDFRWAMFEERGLGPWVAELGVALGCFGGNLVWPIEEFVRVGGFHPQLHHGRCEDGELGLRAASHRIPMALVAGARGYHMAHPIDREEAERRNARDVPMLNAWHPWVQVKCKTCGEVWQGGSDRCVACGSGESTGGLIVTDQDGARFDFVCECGEQVNTLLMWDHMSKHVQLGSGRAEPEPEPELILPDALR